MKTARLMIAGLMAATLTLGATAVSADGYDRRGYDQGDYDERGYDQQGYDNGPRNNPAAMIGGALIGGLLGSRFGGGEGKLWTTGAGVLLGAMVGRHVGANLNRNDQRYLGNASYNSFETGDRTDWRNPDNGNYGYIEPVRGYQSNGRYCREFQQTIYIDGRAQDGYGTACRQSDGSWEIVSTR